MISPGDNQIYTSAAESLGLYTEHASAALRRLDLFTTHRPPRPCQETRPRSTPSFRHFNHEHEARTY